MIPERKLCALCGAKFACGGGVDNEDCWCERFPASGSECAGICPVCKSIAAAEYIDIFLQSSSHEEAIKFASRFREQRQLVERLDYTIEAGRYVFTKWYLLKRGYCCGNGCRNCPYGNAPG